jgi:two-component system CheB/CheR fusion protein
MPVIQVGDHESAKLDANHVYVIAPDRKLEITDTSVGASRFEQARGQRAAIDLFFRSLATSHGDGFAVVLSGSGSDGALGARAVKEGGGLVLVQDPNEATHDDMPRAVIATGVADIVLAGPGVGCTSGRVSARQREHCVGCTRGRGSRPD